VYSGRGDGATRRERKGGEGPKARGRGKGINEDTREPNLTFLGKKGEGRQGGGKKGVGKRGRRYS